MSPVEALSLGMPVTVLLLTVWPCSPGASDAFIIRFICNDDVYPGAPRFLHQDIDSARGIRNTFFEFETALACVPSPVDCQVTGEARGAEQWGASQKCVHVSVWVHMRQCVCALMSVLVCITRVCVHEHACVCMSCVCTSVCLQVCVSVGVCAHEYVWMCVHAHEWVCVRSIFHRQRVICYTLSDA